MLETFMKDMKGIVVEEMTVEEDVEKEPAEKEKKVLKEGEAAQKGTEAEKEEENQRKIVATPVQTTSPPPTIKATPVTISPNKPNVG